MKDLRSLLDEYLSTRRALGTKLVDCGAMLLQFVAFMARHKVVFITTEHAIRWATEPRDVHPVRWTRRLDMVRGLARYAHAVDPRHEIPPRALRYRYRRPPPYIYRDGEIAGLVAAARGMPGTMLPITYATLFGLLAVTGMRSSEPLHLDRKDADLDNGILTVRDGKFGKARHVPVQDSTRQALIRHAEHRDQHYLNPRDPAFFLSTRSARIASSTLNKTFSHLSRQIGLRGQSDTKGPRLQDMRHTFAVNTLQRWYREGVDVERKLPQLATYLGHVNVINTYCNAVHGITVVMPTTQ